MIADNDPEAQYIRDIFETGVDWSTYIDKLEKKDKFLILAEKALLEVLDKTPSVAAIILPLALDMTGGDKVAAFIFQDIVEKHTEKFLKAGDIERDFSNLASIYGLSLRITPIW